MANQLGCASVFDLSSHVGAVVTDIPNTKLSLNRVGSCILGRGRGPGCVVVTAELRTHWAFFASFLSALKTHLPSVTRQVIERHVCG